MDHTTPTTSQLPMYAASLDENGAKALVSKLYGWSTDHIKRLQGYDDLNFYLKISGKPPDENEFVLKVLNSRDSMATTSVGLMQIRIAILQHLRQCEITCPTPVANLRNEYFSLEEIVDKSGQQPLGLKFIVQILTFIPGKMVRDLYLPDKPIPDRWYYVMGRSLGTINKALLSFNTPGLSLLEKHANEFTWSPNCVSKVRDILWAVKDDAKRTLAEKVISELETRVVPKMAELRKCVLHTDFNDMNIIGVRDDTTACDSTWHTSGGLDISTNQDSRLKVTGLIDFSDVVYSNLVFDPSNSQAYMLSSQTHGDPLVSGAHFLAGYNSVLPLTAAETDLIQCCTAGRLVQSLVTGLHAYTLNPNNEYVLDSQKSGWTVLKQLWEKPKSDLINMWEKIADMYHLPETLPSIPNSIEQETNDETSKCVIKIPFLTREDVQRILKKDYEVASEEIEDIKQLNSFEDQNFYIRLSSGDIVERTGAKEFVLKILNSDTSKHIDVAVTRIAVLEFVRARGFCCPEPVTNSGNECFSLEKVFKPGDQTKYGLFNVHLLTYIPGQPISELKAVPQQLLYEAGVHLARLDVLLQEFSHVPDSFKENTPNNPWALENCPKIRKHLKEVKDEARRQLVKSVIKAFEDDVVPKMSTLRKCLIHGDYNDANVLVTESVAASSPQQPKRAKLHPHYEITGVIDFTTVVHSCLVFEIATAMALMMYPKTGDPTSATGHILAGFQSLLPLTPGEIDVLYTCMVAHIAQELVLSLYNHRLQPQNEYVMQTQDCGWRHLQELWGDPDAKRRIKTMWKDIGNSYSK